MTNDINVEVVTVADCEEIVAYVTAFRKQLFPMLDPDIIPFDILGFKEYYIDAPTGVFLKAVSKEGKLLGVIGMMPYNKRFSYFEWPNKNVVEVARLFVEPKYRRAKIGELLVNHLKIYAKKVHVDKLYLHTHPFLTGAFELWEKQGFLLIKKTQDAGFTTLHMELDLK